MIQAYKLPIGSDINYIKSLQGSDGTFLNPVQDINGYYFVSQECYNDGQFSEYKSTVFDNCILIEFIAPQISIL